MGSSDFQAIFRPSFSSPPLVSWLVHLGRFLLGVNEQNIALYLCLRLDVGLVGAGLRDLRQNCSLVRGFPGRAQLPFATVYSSNTAGLLVGLRKALMRVFRWGGL